MQLINTVFEDGFSWVEIEDSAWKRAVFNTYINGMDVG